MSVSIISFPFWLEIAKIFLNLTGTKHKYRIIIASKGYLEINLLWGLVHLEKGEKKEFVIIGTEKYLELVRRWLLKQNISITKIIGK